MAGKFEIKRSRDGKFMFNLLASNGEPILSSQRYTSKTSAKNGIESIRKNCGSDNMFNRKAAKNGQDYFVLKANNGRVIGQSEQYKTRRAMENGIKSVQRNARAAKILDLTLKG